VVKKCALFRVNLMKTHELLKELRHKEELKSVVLNAPKSIQEEFGKRGFLITAKKPDRFQFALLFVRDKAEVEKHLRPTIDNVEYDSVFWIAYPKGGSPMKTDINRDILWELLKPFGYQPVSQIAIDKDWSAMRLRPIEQVKSK